MGVVTETPSQIASGATGPQAVVQITDATFKGFWLFIGIAFVIVALLIAGVVYAVIRAGDAERDAKLALMASVRAQAAIEARR